MNDKIKKLEKSDNGLELDRLEKVTGGAELDPGRFAELIWMDQKPEPEPEPGFKPANLYTDGIRSLDQDNVRSLDCDKL